MNGTQLKTWRTKHRLSQAAVGRLLHTTTTTVYRWEAGIHPMPELALMVLRLLPPKVLAGIARRVRKTSDR